MSFTATSFTPLARSVRGGRAHLRRPSIFFSTRFKPAVDGVNPVLEPFEAAIHGIEAAVHAVDHDSEDRAEVLEAVDDEALGVALRFGYCSSSGTGGFSVGRASVDTTAVPATMSWRPRLWRDPRATNRLISGPSGMM